MMQRISVAGYQENKQPRAERMVAGMENLVGSWAR